MSAQTYPGAKELYDRQDELRPTERPELAAKTVVGSLFLAKGPAEGGAETRVIDSFSPLGQVLAEPEPSVFSVRVADHAAVARDIVDADTVSRPTEVKPIYCMYPDELDAAAKADKAKDDALLTELFGDKAKRYNSLQRTANGSDAVRANAASAEIERMEAELSQRQRERLYGIGEGHTHEDYADFAMGLRAIAGDTPGDLGASMRWAITKMGDIKDPAAMTLHQQKAYAQLRHGFEIADENGWDKNEVLQASLESAAGRFSNRQDAAFMLRQFIAPAARA